MKASVLSRMILGMLCISSSVFAEGNGGGVNGPDLRGQAVPINLDREISEKLVQQVTVACEKKFARSLWVQIFNRDPADYPERKFHVQGVASPIGRDIEMWEYRSKGFGGSAGNAAGGIESFWSYGAVELNGTYPGIVVGRPEQGVDDLNILAVLVTSMSEALFGYGSVGYRNFKTQYTRLVNAKGGNFAIPYFSYSVVGVDSNYDDLGNLLSDRRVVRDLKLINGKVAAPEPLINVTTQRPIAMKVDFRELRDCLLEGVQR